MVGLSNSIWSNLYFVEQQNKPVEQGNVLSFLRKNSKIKGSKLKWAARTQIDLKTLNCNPEEVENILFDDSFYNQRSPVNQLRCETAIPEYDVLNTESDTNKITVASASKLGNNISLSNLLLVI